MQEKEKYKKQSLEGSTTDSELLQIYMRRKYYERDLAYLNMIDSFTQDAPQLLLQAGGHRKDSMDYQKHHN